MVPTSVKATPTRRTLYQGVAVFGISPPLTVGVAVGFGFGVAVGAIVAVDVSVGVGVAVDISVGVGVVVGAGVSRAAQNPFVMVLESSVTAPVCANNCPCTVAPCCAAMDVNAKMCPTKWEFVPNVAELPTFQKIRQYRAALMGLILLPDDVISVEAVINTKTPLGSP